MAVGLLAAASACGGKQPFPGSASDLDALGRDVLEAFVQHDRQTLESLRLTETEHNTVVWPELPAAQGPSPYPSIWRGRTSSFGTSARFPER